MGDLIYTNELIHRICELPDLRRLSLKTLGNIIKECTVVDAELVRHGRNVTPLHFSDEFVCSECGFGCEILELRYGDDGMGEPQAYEYDCKFCPNCGAKMDGES